MIQSKLVLKSFEHVKSYLESNASELPYHNFGHSKTVAEEVYRLAKKADLGKKNTENLVLAALFHDIGYTIDPKIHEEISADYAEKYLLENDLDPARVTSIKSYILATKLSWDGIDTNSEYLRDADLNGLASENYEQLNKNLRNEKTKVEGVNITEQEWIDQNISFFKQHTYHTEEAKELYGKGKKRNYKLLMASKKEFLEEIQLTTIGSSKAAQTQLKTSLRNHINLSAIADNKANIMLSVNAIVITVGLPMMSQQVFENKLFLIPIFVLGLSSVISMAFATLSTRPIKMNGLTDLEQIAKKKTNLFFFGNFFEMKFDEYELGIKQVVGDEEILENSITRDLFFLGKSLGAKFNHLRICYNAFLIGMILTVALFIILSTISQFQAG